MAYFKKKNDLVSQFMQLDWKSLMKAISYFTNDVIVVQDIKKVDTKLVRLDPIFS